MGVHAARPTPLSALLVNYFPSGVWGFKDERECRIEHGVARLSLCYHPPLHTHLHTLGVERVHHSTWQRGIDPVACHPRGRDYQFFPLFCWFF